MQRKLSRKNVIEYYSHFFRTCLGYEWFGAALAHRRQQLRRPFRYYDNYPHHSIQLSSLLRFSIFALPQRERNSKKIKQNGNLRSAFGLAFLLPFGKEQMYRTVCGRERNNIDRIDAAVCGMTASVCPRIAPQLLFIMGRSSGREHHRQTQFQKWGKTR